MSIQILTIDHDTRCIYAIADKRIGSAGTNEAGEMFNWTKKHDNAIKIVPINDNLMVSGGILEDMSTVFIGSLTQVAHLKPSEIIAYAKQLNRFVTPPYGTMTHNPEIIFGIYDCGTPFYWFAEQDGSDELKLVTESFNIQIGGGMKGTSIKAGEFLKKLMRRKVDFKEVLIRTIEYAASIDKVISPSYDLIIKPF
jgi:hypothetical protein